MTRAFRRYFSLSSPSLVIALTSLLPHFISTPPPLSFDSNRLHSSVQDLGQILTPPLPLSFDSNRLHSSVQDLGQACVGLVKAGGSCQAAPADPGAQRDVLDANKLVQDKVTGRSGYRLFGTIVPHCRPRLTSIVICLL